MSHLLLQPSSLQFPLILNEEVVRLLLVSNQSSRSTVTFKVKTTSPRRYSVRPTRGVLSPGDQEQITITLHALQKLPSDADDCRDRFKVLSLPLDHSQAIQLHEVAHEQRRALLDGLWEREGGLTHVSVAKVLCSFEKLSPPSCSSSHEKQARRSASRPGLCDDVHEPSPSSTSRLLRCGDSNRSCTEEQPRREGSGLAAPVAERAVIESGGGLCAVPLGGRLGLRHRQGWYVDPSYGWHADCTVGTRPILERERALYTLCVRSTAEVSETLRRREVHGVRQRARRASRSGAAGDRRTQSQTPGVGACGDASESLLLVLNDDTYHSTRALTTRVRGSRVTAARKRAFCRTPSCVHSSSLARHHCFRAIQALVSLITAFATSCISSALSLTNGRGRSSSDITALSPTRTSLPRCELRWCIWRR